MCTCSNLVKTTSIVESSGTLRLTIPAQTLVNGQKICVCLAQPVTTTGIDSMVLVVGTTAYSILTKCGNKLYSDQKYAGTCKTVATPRTVLCVRYASDTTVFVYDGKNPICPTHFSFPVTPPASAAFAEAESAPATKPTKVSKE